MQITPEDKPPSTQRQCDAESKTDCSLSTNRCNVGAKNRPTTKREVCRRKESQPW
ncbi:unnamed protein product [Brassica oleracea var. botrytis]